MTGGAGSALRRCLWPLSLAYAAVMAARNAAYDRGWLRSHHLPVPVVSVGNLTVGGTGKTPLVAWLVAEARRLGRRPGVLARGYGREPGSALNDEGAMLAARFEGLPQVQDPDRVRGGRRLVAEHGVDLVVVDDGFQHRRLHRDRDLVCLDAERPFAQDLVLPAGDLRELPCAALRRAGVVVLTRADRLDPPAVQSRTAALRACARRELPVLACRHVPTALVDLHTANTESPAALSGRRVLLVAAIARPSAFRATLEELGAVVADEVVFRDHHRYERGDVERIVDRARKAGAGVVTTEKDAVKLRAFDLDARVLRIDVGWLGPPPAPAEVGLA